MNETGGPKASDLVPRPQTGEPKKIKIGAVAKYFGVSVDLLRLYEREGLLIPLKSPKGTRYFTERDYPWIATVLRLVREARLNFAGIRHLLALIPCWDILKCGETSRHDCSAAKDATAPCWVDQNCCRTVDCYACDIYRAAYKCENLKAFVANEPSR